MKKKLIGGFILILAIAVISLVFSGVGDDQEARERQKTGGIAVIRVEGPIMGGRSDGVFSSYAGSATIMEQLRAAADDDWVKAVVLRLNTPGGGVAASQEIGDEIIKLKESGKVVVASMGDVAASGGYWLAAQTDEIVANPATVTGSIGVIMTTQNLEELYDKLGIKQENIKSGQLKDMGSPMREMTGEERQILQDIVDDMFEQFVEVVSTGRQMERETVLSLADGRIFTGKQALELGLVDQLGNYYHALQVAAELAQLPEDPPVREMGRTSPWANFFSGIDQLLKPAIFQHHHQQWLENW